MVRISFIIRVRDRVMVRVRVRDRVRVRVRVRVNDRLRNIVWVTVTCRFMARPKGR